MIDETSAMTDPLPVLPVDGPFDIAIRLPGSKSMTNRIFVLAALAKGTSRIRGSLVSDDTVRLLVALSTLGVVVEHDGDDVLVTGCSGSFPNGGHVDLADGGTPTRFVLALATLAKASVVIDGSARMRERPVDEGIGLLRAIGASIEATTTNGVERLPVTVHPSTLRGGEVAVGQTASSQFISALLLIAPCLSESLVLRYDAPPTSAAYLDLTVSAMQSFGISVIGDRDASGILRGHRVAPQSIAPRYVVIEADASSAAYFAVAAAIIPGARVELIGFARDSRQPDLRLLDALASMGAAVERSADRVVVVGPERLRAISVNASQLPDASMALAMACACAQGTSTIRGLTTLRVKETDRITALATELSRVGCDVAATDDSLRITPSAARTDSVTISTRACLTAGCCDAIPLRPRRSSVY